MSSTFFGLTIAASGLNVAQAQINTTANNISNVNTDGYSKQVVNTVAASALRTYQKFGTTGTGVEATGVSQARDLYYDEKYWSNQADLGFYEKRLYYMNQIEGFYSETGSSTGFTTIYTKMFNALSTVQGNAGDETVRKEFIADAKELTNYFNGLATKLNDLQSSINDEIKTAVDDINAIAEKIAILNKQINTIEQGGATANELRDQRALLVDSLSEYVTTETREVEVKNSNYPDMDTGATYYTVTIAGQTLVDNYEYKTLSCVAREDEEKYNQCDIEGLYDIVWTEDGDTFNPCGSIYTGSLKSMFEVRDGNNKENMHGIVSDAGIDYITIKDPSSDDINELNIPNEGTIWVNNTKYTYDSFELTMDAEGKIDTIKYNLTDDINLSSDVQSDLSDRKLQVGTEVDFMGIPYYQNQMNIFLRNFCEAFNDIEESGVTLDGDAMGAFFIANSKLTTDEYDLTEDTVLYETDPSTGDYVLDADGNKIPEAGKVISSSDNSYYLLTAEEVGIAYATDKDSSLFATTTLENYTSGQDAADLVVLLQSLQSSTERYNFRGSGGDAFLQCIYADVTVDTQESSIFTTNYTNIQESIEQQRLSVSGVDEDDEALDLIKFQNAYNLASKAISVFSEIYDRLILETGV